jgi:hypothetical protein
VKRDGRSSPPWWTAAISIRLLRDRLYPSSIRYSAIDLTSNTIVPSTMALCELGALGHADLRAPTAIIRLLRLLRWWAPAGIAHIFSFETNMSDYF